MPFDQAAILQQTDDVVSRVKTLIAMSKYSDLSDVPEQNAGEAATLLRSTIERLAPTDSSYVKNIGQTTVYSGTRGLRESINPMVGIVNALRLACVSGYLASVQELTHADLFSDFLEMAGHLLESGFKDPAAVISGSVLEEHLRKLAVKNGLGVLKPDGSPKKADTLNSELAAKTAYSKLDQKNVTAWLDLRNKAAHGQYAAYTKDQVSLMLQSVRDFIARLPA